MKSTLYTRAQLNPSIKVFIQNCLHFKSNNLRKFCLNTLNLNNYLIFKTKL